MSRVAWSVEVASGPPAGRGFGGVSLPPLEVRRSRPVPAVVPAAGLAAGRLDRPVSDVPVVAARVSRPVVVEPAPVGVPVCRGSAVVAQRFHRRVRLGIGAD